MACVGEVPFRRYYGSVDSTPLFVLLAAAYFKRTGDRELIVQIWSNIEKALHWIDRYGDRDGDGFVEYGRLTPKGLLQQGWKDSQDRISRRSAYCRAAPYALCEVQGLRLRRQARNGRCFQSIRPVRTSPRVEQTEKPRLLKKRFHDAFWCEEISTYRHRLWMGTSRRCQSSEFESRTHLFSGNRPGKPCRQNHRRAKSRRTIFSGSGIRTIAAGEARYNPMSYHNGSVWPHDNALISYGLRRAENKALAVDILTGLFDASSFLEAHRLPELFCGFAKRNGMAPTLYPVACAPQAWAAGAVFGA